MLRKVAQSLIRFGPDAARRHLSTMGCGQSVIDTNPFDDSIIPTKSLGSAGFELFSQSLNNMVIPWFYKTFDTCIFTKLPQNKAHETMVDFCEAYFV